jgi:putative lipoprotein
MTVRTPIAAALVPPTPARARARAHVDRRSRPSLYWALGCFAALPLVAGAAGGDAGSGGGAGSDGAGAGVPAVITGTVTTADGGPLPANAVLELVVADVSRADAPAVTIARREIARPGPLPLRFELPYDAAAVEARYTYSVRARVLVEGELRWTTTRTNPVLTRGAGRDVALVLERVGAPPPKPDRDLRNTYWKLFELNGRPSTVAERQREPHLILQLQQDRVVGSGGCNRFTGTYALHGDFVRFERLAAAEKACPQGMEQEGEYLATLARVRSWRVHGEGLALLDERNAVVARFRAVDLR